MGRLSSKEIAKRLGVSYRAVQTIRYRYGRWGSPDEKVCCVCRARPVWEGNKRARHMQLCSGCFEREMAQRRKEAELHNLRRQKEFQDRRRKDKR